MTTLLGRWKLVEARAFDESGKELEPPLGPNPMGVILYEADRMIVAIGNGSPNVSQEAAQRTFASLIGRYTFDGEMLRIRADAATSPGFGGDQFRRIKFDGPDRYVATPVSAEGRSSGQWFTWERTS